MEGWTPSRLSSCGAAKPEKGGEEPPKGFEGVAPPATARRPCAGIARAHVDALTQFMVGR